MIERRKLFGALFSFPFFKQEDKIPTTVLISKLKPMELKIDKGEIQKKVEEYVQEHINPQINKLMDICNLYMDLSTFVIDTDYIRDNNIVCTYEWIK